MPMEGWFISVSTHRRVSFFLSSAQKFHPLDACQLSFKADTADTLSSIDEIATFLLDLDRPRVQIHFAPIEKYRCAIVKYLQNCYGLNQPLRHLPRAPSRLPNHGGAHAQRGSAKLTEHIIGMRSLMVCRIKRMSLVNRQHHPQEILSCSWDRTAHETRVVKNQTAILHDYTANCASTELIRATWQHTI